jgi:hypothetical protein
MEEGDSGSVERVLITPGEDDGLGATNNAGAGQLCSGLPVVEEGEGGTQI